MSTLDDLMGVLQIGATDFDAGGEQAGFSLLDHGLQCAYQLLRQRPDDLELQVAGLVHDIGQTLAGNDEGAHGVAAARFVQPVLGARVADLVELHVPAKRYLVTTDAAYLAGLSEASRRSLLAQGAVMTIAEVRDFEDLPHCADALTLRRADDAAKVRDARVPALQDWLPAIRAVHDRVVGSVDGRS